MASREFTCKLSSKSRKIDMFDWNPLFCSFRDSGFRSMIIVVEYVALLYVSPPFWVTNFPGFHLPWHPHPLASEVWKDVEPGQLASAFQKDPPDGPTEYGQILQKLEKNIFPGALSALGM